MFVFAAVAVIDFVASLADKNIEANEILGVSVGVVIYLLLGVTILVAVKWHKPGFYLPFLLLNVIPNTMTHSLQRPISANQPGLRSNRHPVLVGRAGGGDRSPCRRRPSHESGE